MSTDAPLPPVTPGKTNESRSLLAALLAAQQLVEGVAKSARNKVQSYNYASSEAVIAAGREWLNAAGLTLSLTARNFAAFDAAQAAAVAEPASDSRESGNKPVGWVITTYTLAHAASGETQAYAVPFPVVVSRGRPIDKALAGAQTAGLAYFLRDLLLIDRDDDGSAMDARNDAAPLAPRKAPPPPVVAPASPTKPADVAAAVAPTPAATPTAENKPTAKPAAEYPEIVALATPAELAKMGPAPIDESKAKTYLVALRARREGEKAAGASAGATKSHPTTAPTTPTATAATTNGSKPGKGMTTPLPG